MTHRTALIASLLLAAGVPAGAQSPAASAPPTTASSTAPAASSEPSPELVKEARREGFTPKKRDGVTKFCRKDATLGTRFETEKCVDEAGLKALAQQREDQRNILRQPGACTGSNCSGH